MKFSIPQKFRLSALLYNKKFTVALSIILAFSLWLGIAMTENTVREEEFKNLSVNVSLEGTAAETLGLGIFSDVSTQKFTVTVEGPNHIVSSLKSDDFILSASTYEINSAKTYNLAISAENTNVKSGYKIVSIEPSTVEVTVDYVVSKDFTVTPKIVGAKPGEGLIWDEEDLMIADTKQKTINITGPRSKMEKIKSVYAVAETNETLLESKTFDADIILCDENDKELYRFRGDGTVLDSYNNPVPNSFLTLSFKNTKFMVKVSKQKTVKCEPVFTNLPDGITVDDFKFELYTNVTADEQAQQVEDKNYLENNEITIKGDPDTIDKIEKLTLSPIDFSEVSINQNSFEVSIEELPEGVEIIENFEYFTVDIDLSNFREKTFTVNTFRYSGLDNLNAKPEKENISVKICAPSDIVNKIKASDLYFIFDLSGKTAGKFEIVPVLKSDIYNNIWQVGKTEIFVTLY